MSLNMYLGEVQSQTNTMYAFCTATIQSMEQVIQSIDSFVGDSVLQGQTYDSAKMYFAETFLPLAQGIIYLCEELLRQNEAFPAEFQSRVASTDVVEQELLEQIREIDRMIASIEVTKQIMPLPNMDAMVNLFIEMRRKIQEKLEHLYEFNQTSSNNYATAIQLAASITSGLAEVQSGKGFSPASGTFSTQRLNMEWADSIYEYLDTNIRLDNSIKTNNLIESGILLGSSSEKNILEKFITGVWNGSGKFIGGLVETYKSLDDTVTKENLKYAAGHPIETAYTMMNTFSDTFMNEFWHGDAESRTQWGTNIFMELGLGWIGDKGAGRIGKVTSLGDPVNLTRFSKNIPPISSQLPLKDRFAFAGGDSLKSRFDTPDFKQAEEKLSTYQFANGARINGGNVPYSFDSSLMEHLFHGELRQKWWGLKAVGYHHESMMGGGEIVRITHAPNSVGVYKAKVKVDGEAKTALSSFFPRDWDRVQVLDSIKEAFNNKVQVDTVRYVGQTSHGFKVEMIIKNNEIITAYPVYTRR
ncbi:EndoU domain-containing protein [Bacillus toyonensis]|uniref:EndoU domain-containing protein n=1 Tax=Bacillus toyonensis TaxID=155322 RepID=UPI0018A1A6AD|nr:EndoU domain-containing protein [Bacillus toyonensis]MBF7149963.1 EndoU domain-containing protein [Bacillus toyonensis]MEC2351591.1 EndoU domain-containing protein [Bacillus toyonensis]MED3189461.1 EndoU domain-containing protein [Bacillus toyonensis]